MTGALLFWLIVSNFIGALIMTQLDDLSLIHYVVGGLLSSLVGTAAAMINWWHVERMTNQRYERNPVILGDKDEL